MERMAAVSATIEAEGYPDLLLFQARGGWVGKSVEVQHELDIHDVNYGTERPTACGLW